MFGELQRGLEGLFVAELGIGLAVGAVALLAWTARPSTRPVAGIGLVLAVAVAVATRSGPLLLVVAAVAAVPLVAGGVGPPAAAIPVAGAALAARPPGAALAACAVAAVLLAGWSRPDRGAGGPRVRWWETPAPVFVVSALGWYAGLPDTEAALAALGAAVASMPRAPAEGWASGWGVGAAVVLLGAAGRTGAVVGGLLCFGIALLPLSARRPLPLLAVHLAVVVYASRMVGVERDPARALALAVPVVLALAASGLLLVVRTRRESAGA